MPTRFDRRYGTTEKCGTMGIAGNIKTILLHFISEDNPFFAEASKGKGTKKEDGMAQARRTAGIDFNTNSAPQFFFKCSGEGSSPISLFTQNTPKPTYSSLITSNFSLSVSPFGVVLQEREFSSSSYRYTFQNQEHDDELKGEGNSINFTYRMHDPRLGRFFAVDQLSYKYPDLSNYQFGGNRLIDFVEFEGLEGLDAYFKWAFKNVPTKTIEANVNSTIKNNIISVTMKRVIVDTYKSVFSDQSTAPKLIEHYAYGKGKDYKMSNFEMFEILPAMDRSNNTVFWTEQEWKQKTWLIGNGSIEMKKTSQVYARKAGTLGNFTMTISGTYDEENGFVGTLEFEDVYDFNAGTHRPWSAEMQVTIARNTLPGQPFKVTGILNIKIDPKSPNEIMVYDENWNYLTTINWPARTSDASKEGALEEPKTEVKSEESTE